ncbi:MAG: PqqD family protein [Proteiniphilum sp.]|jgi:hypothetical protein|nr:PqqD family protein [Proteiniphilum sp.]
MKLKENFNIRQIGDEYMMISDSGSGLDYTRVISLNKTAAFLIGTVQQKNFRKEDWVDLLIDEYGIDRKQAETDVQALIDKLISEELVER